MPDETQSSTRPAVTESSSTRNRRGYEKPRLVDYGHVSKLTLTGGITTRDTGSKKRVCL